MKKISITRMNQLERIPNDTRIEIVGSTRERWLVKTTDGMFLVDDGGGFDLSQAFLDQNPLVAFVTSLPKSPKKKRINKISKLKGIPDGTPVEFGPNDRERHIYGCDNTNGEILITDDSGGFILDQEFLDQNPIYITIVNRSDLKPSLRFEILKRDNFTCQACGSSRTDGAKLEVDHRVPISKGGTHSLENLWTLCFECNRGKGIKCI